MVCLAIMPTLSPAQFTDPLTFGGAGNENGRHIISDSQGGFFVAGTFDAPFAPIDDPLPVYGEEDFFLGRVDGQGNWQWIKSGGSFLNDEIRVLRLMPDGGLLMAGTFWLELTYEGLTLTTSDNIKGIFIIRLDEQGNWQWGKVINGADLKEINDVKIASEGEIYVTGHFSEALQFDTLQMEASGENDAFLLQLTPDGVLESRQQIGYSGTTRGQTIALHPAGGFYWGGVFDDTLRVDTTELYANTFDRDVFVSRYDAAGNPLWIRRAGGVFEEELIAMTTDVEGNLLATGFLIGVMSLSETVSIQSRNGNPDIFLFSYDEMGSVQWARAIGGDLIDLPTDLCLLKDQVIISGTYQGQIAWDAFSTPQTNGVNGFAASFDQSDGAGKWLLPVTTESFAFVEALTLDTQQQLYLLGSFRDDAQLGGLTINSAGQYDFFLAGIAAEITPVLDPVLRPGIRVFPNPSREILYLDGLQEGASANIRLYNSAGKLVYQGISRNVETTVNLGGLRSGTYWLIVQQGNHLEKLPVVIIR